MASTDDLWARFSRPPDTPFNRFFGTEDKTAPISEASRQSFLIQARDNPAAIGGGTGVLDFMAQDVFERLPFGSSIAAIGNAGYFSAAQNRINTGNGTAEDYALLARRDVARDNQQNQSLGQSVFDTVSRLPGMAGEFAVGGAFIGQGAGLLGRAASIGARTLAAPSMYIPEATQRAEANGGQWYNLSNLAPAIAVGYINTAILGSVAKFAGKIGGNGLMAGIKRVGASTFLGLGEQEGADILAGTIGLSHDYGLLATGLSKGFDSKEFVHGAVGRAITFATFAGMHESMAGRPPMPAARTVLEAYRDARSELIKGGMDAKEADRVLGQMQSDVLQPDNYPQFLEQLDGLPDSHAKTYGRMLIDLMQGPETAQTGVELNRQPPAEEFGPPSGATAFRQTTRTPAQGTTTPAPPAADPFGNMQFVRMTDAMGITDKIVKMLADGMSARKIADALKIDDALGKNSPASGVAVVRSVRNGLGIPSASASFGWGGGAGGKVTPEFVAWQQQYKDGKWTRPDVAPQQAQQQARGGNASAFRPESDPNARYQPDAIPASQMPQAQAFIPEPAGQRPQATYQERLRMLQDYALAHENVPIDGYAKSLGLDVADPNVRSLMRGRGAGQVETTGEPVQRPTEPPTIAPAEQVTNTPPEAGQTPPGASGEVVKAPEAPKGVDPLSPLDQTSIRPEVKDITRATMEGAGLTKVEQYVWLQSRLGGEASLRNLAEDPKLTRLYGGKMSHETVRKFWNSAAGKLGVTESLSDYLKGNKESRAAETGSQADVAGESRIGEKTGKKFVEPMTEAEKQHTANVAEFMQGKAEPPTVAMVNLGLWDRIGAAVQSGADPAKAIHAAMPGLEKLVTAGKIKELADTYKELSNEAAKDPELAQALQRAFTVEIPQSALPAPEGPQSTPGNPEGIPGQPAPGPGEGRTGNEAGVDTLYHTPGQPAIPPGWKTTAKGPPPSAAQLIATIDHFLDVANYNVKKITDNPNASAAARLRAQHIETTKLNANDPTIRLEEAVHVAVNRLGIELDPAKLSRDVAEGFREFYNPTQPLNERTIQEGFAQWAIRRAKQELKGLTPEQEAANKFGEQWLADKKLDKPLDEIGLHFRKWDALSPAEKLGATISKTGEPAEPVGVSAKDKAGDTVASTWERFQERVENDVAVLGRMVKDAMRKGMSMGAAGAQAMKSALALRWQSRAWGKNWAEHGFPTVAPDGSWKPASKGYAEVTQPLKKGEIDLYNTYAKAKQDVSDYQTWFIGAATSAGTKRQQTVSQEQYKAASAALKEISQNPDQLQRFEQVNQDRVATLNQGLQFLVEIGRLKQEWVDKQVAAHPDYVSKERVVDDITENDYWFMKERKVSGEETRPALDTFLERFSDIAAVAQKHIKDQSVLALLREKGMGQWAREMDTKEPDDQTKHIYPLFENGERVRFMVRDSALWEYLSKSQTDGSNVAAIGNALANLGPTVWGTPLGSLPTKAIRHGAILFSPIFHVQDALRSWREFVSNTQNMSSAKDLPSWYAQWFHFIARGALAEGSKAKPYIDLYERLAGDSQRWITQGEDPGKVYQGFSKFAQEVIRRLSYAEMVPRALEMKNELDKMGINAKTVEGWNKTGEMPPLPQQVALLNASAEIHNNYQRQGIDTRAWGKVIPFLGAHVAGTSKFIRNWKDNPKGALMGLGILAAMRLAYWAANKDDVDYQEQSVGTRNDFYIKTPLGRVRIAGPQGLAAPIGALMDESLRASSRSNPHFDRLAPALLNAVFPNAPEPLNTIGQVIGNRTGPFGIAGGYPIVPHQEEGAGGASNFARFQLPYLAERMTGGAVSAHNPLVTAVVGRPTPHQSVNDYNDQLHTLQQERTYAMQRGGRLSPEDEATYQRLNRVSQMMERLNGELQGKRRIGARIIAGEKPESERQAQIREQMVRLARQALGR